jgi:hypothetical protein
MQTFAAIIFNVRAFADFLYGTTYMRKIVVAITGASGSIYAKNLFEKFSQLKDHWTELGIVMSANAQEVWQTELGNDSYKNLPENFMLPRISRLLLHPGQVNTIR